MGLPVARLTDKQENFVRGILRGQTPRNAARLAGYCDNTAAAHQIFAVPAVLAAIELGLRRELHGVLAPLAMATIKKILTAKGEEYTPRLKLDAAKIALDRAGFIPPKQSAANTGEDKAPESMSTSELQEAIARIERELGERARVIVPDSAPDDSQLSDLL